MSRFGEFNERDIERMISGKLEAAAEAAQVIKPEEPAKVKIFGKRFILGCVIAFFVFTFISIPIVYYRCLKGKPIRISTSTTLLEAPLDTKGTGIDYYKVIEEKYFSPYVSKESNGFIALARELGEPGILGTSDLFEHESSWELICEKIGLDPSIEPKVQYRDLLLSMLDIKLATVDTPEFDPFFYESGYLEQTRRDYERITHGVWDESKYPDTYRWLVKNGEALDRFSEAVRSPVFIAPMIKEKPDRLMFNRLRYDLDLLDSFALGLRVRATFLLGKGELEKALDDALSLIRLSRHLAQVPEFDYLCKSMFCETKGSEIAINILKQKKLSPERLLEFQKNYSELPERLPFEDFSTVHKYRTLEAFTAISEERASMDDINKRMAMLYPLFSSWYGIDWNIAIERFLGQWKRLEDFVSEPSSENRKEVLDSFKTELLTRKKYRNFTEQLYRLSGVSERSVQYGDVMLIATFPTVFDAMAMYWGTEIAKTCLETIIALERYRAEKGELPLVLIELLNDGYLNEIPLDPYDKTKPFAYVPDPNGLFYTLRSVGPNGLNDIVKTIK